MSTARKRAAGTATPRRKAAPKGAKRPVAQAAVKGGVKAARKTGNGTAGATASIPGDVYGEAMLFGQEQLGRAASTLFRGYDEVADFSKGNVEALMLSGNIVVRGVEDIGKAWLDLGQKSLQSGAVLAQAFAGVRTLQELVELQTDLARTTLDRLLSESARISELSAKVANEAVAPLQARVGTAFGLMLKREAA
jgi:phasin family protein